MQGKKTNLETKLVRWKHHFKLMRSFQSFLKKKSKITSAEKHKKWQRWEDPTHTNPSLTESPVRGDHPKWVNFDISTFRRFDISKLSFARFSCIKLAVVEMPLFIVKNTAFLDAFLTVKRESCFG